jgi:hypothetical protein
LATAIEVIGARFAVLNDRDLSLVMSILVEDTEPDPRELEPYLERWRKGITWAGPGTISLYLDEIVRDGLADVIGRALERVAIRLERFGNWIPVDILNARYRSQGQRFLDTYPVERLQQTVDQLLELLAPEREDE